MEGGSYNTTVNIFAWVKNIERGLWLRSGSESSSDVRRLMRHDWIADEEDDEELRSSSCDTVPNLHRVQEWLADSEKCPPEPPEVVI